MASKRGSLAPTQFDGTPTSSGVLLPHCLNHSPPTWASYITSDPLPAKPPTLIYRKHIPNHITSLFTTHHLPSNCTVTPRSWSSPSTVSLCRSPSPLLGPRLAFHATADPNRDRAPLHSPCFLHFRPLHTSSPPLGGSFQPRCLFPARLV